MTVRKADRAVAVYRDMLDQFRDNCGISEQTAIHDIVENAEVNDVYEHGKTTSEGLDVLDASLAELSEYCDVARKFLKERRNKRKI